MKTYDRIQAAFPGAQVPAQVVVKANDVTSPKAQEGIRSLERSALATGQMSEPIQVRINPDRTVAVVSIPLQGEGNDAASKQALETLRDRLIPATLGRIPGTTTASCRRARARFRRRA